MYDLVFANDNASVIENFVRDFEEYTGRFRDLYRREKVFVARKGSVFKCMIFRTIFQSLKMCRTSYVR